MVIGLVVVLLLGAVWTAKRRSARASQDPVASFNDQLNEINNKGTKDRLRLEEERRKLRQTARGSVPSAKPPSLPAGLTEQGIRAGIEACSEFRAPVTIALPKSFPRLGYDRTLDRYPALFPAIRDLLVKLDPPFDPASRSSSFDYSLPAVISVNVTPIGRMKMRVNDFGDDYEIDLGRRRIDSIGAFFFYNQAVQVSFRWKFEDPIAKTFVSNESSFDAVANFLEQGGSWSLQRVTLSKEGRSVTVCGR